MLKSLLISSFALNFGLLLGRLSGFIREAFVAASYGATGEADVVVLMLTVPDLLVNILVGGALGAALIPEFNRLLSQSQQLLYQSMLFFGVLFAGVTVLLYGQIEVLIALLAPGFSGEQTNQSIAVLSRVIWLIPMTVLTGVMTAYLQSKSQFFVAALGTLIINSSIIIGLLLVYLGYGSLSLVAAFVLLGGVLRLLSQASQINFDRSPLESFRPWLLNRDLLTHYGQAMLSGSILLFFPVVARAFASFQGEGGVALFNYATRLVEFPLAVAVTFLSTVFFPRLSWSFSVDTGKHRNLVQYGTRATLGLSLVAAIALISQDEAYVEVVYGYGGMQKQDLVTVSKLVSIGMIMLPLQGVAVFLTAVFNSRKDTRTPMLLNLLGLLFFILISSHGFWGQSLEVMMWEIVVSYGMIVTLQLFVLKIENLSWLSVLFGKEFLLGVICSLGSLFFFGKWVSSLHISAWTSLLLMSFFSLFSLFLMAMFNRELRSGLMARQEG